MATKKNGKWKLAVAGAAVGATAALLSQKENREKLKKGAVKLKDAAVKEGKVLKEKVEDLAGKAADKLEDVKDAVQSRVDEVKEAGKETEQKTKAAADSAKKTAKKAAGK